MTETISLLVFTVGSLRLGMRLEAVERAMLACEVTPLPGAPEPVVGVINVHGAVTPVLDLRRRLRLPQRPISIDDQLMMVRDDARRYAVVVDEIDGVHEFAAERLVPGGDLVEGLAHLQGVVRLPDGLLLVEDPKRFLDVEGLRTLAQALCEAGEHAG